MGQHGEGGLLSGPGGLVSSPRLLPAPPWPRLRRWRLRAWRTCCTRRSRSLRPSAAPTARSSIAGQHAPTACWRLSTRGGGARRTTRCARRVRCLMGVGQAGSGLQAVDSRATAGGVLWPPGQLCLSPCGTLPLCCPPLQASLRRTCCATCSLRWRWDQLLLLLPPGVQRGAREGVYLERAAGVDEPPRPPSAAVLPPHAAVHLPRAGPSAAACGQDGEDHRLGGALNEGRGLRCIQVVPAGRLGLGSACGLCCSPLLLRPSTAAGGRVEMPRQPARRPAPLEAACLARALCAGLPDAPPAAAALLLLPRLPCRWAAPS